MSILDDLSPQARFDLRRLQHVGAVRLTKRSMIESHFELIGKGLAEAFGADPLKYIDVRLVRNATHTNPAARPPREAGARACPNALGHTRSVMA